MWKSYLRSLEAVAPASLEGIRPRAPGAPDLVLRCHAAGCSACARFDTEGRADFEERTFRRADVVAFDCRGAQQRRLALGAGVDQLPAYIVLSSSTPTPRVVRPPSSDQSRSGD